MRRARYRRSTVIGVIEIDQQPAVRELLRLQVAARAVGRLSGQCIREGQEEAVPVGEQRELGLLPVDAELERAVTGVRLYRARGGLHLDGVFFRQPLDLNLQPQVGILREMLQALKVLSLPRCERTMPVCSEKSIRGLSAQASRLTNP